METSPKKNLGNFCKKNLRKTKKKFFGKLDFSNFSKINPKNDFMGKWHFMSAFI